MVSRILALLAWAAVAASLAFWGLRWFAKPTTLPPGTGSVSMSAAAPRGDVTRLLSPPADAASQAQVPSQQAALAARLQLVGVVAPRQSGDGPGVALLAVDGKPPRAYRIGHAVDGDMVLQSVTQQGVQIGPRDGPAAVTLNLPLLPPPATGMLSQAIGLGQAPTPGMPSAQPAYQAPPPPEGGMAEISVEGAEAPQPSNETATPPQQRPRPRLMRRGGEGPPPDGGNG